MEKSLTAQPLPTPLFREGQDLESFVLQHGGPHLRPRTLLAVTSKLFSIAEGRRAPRSENKRALIEREADLVLGETLHHVVLTVKHGVLFPTAGIDESNAEQGDYLLLPSQPFESLARLYRHLRTHTGISEFGLIMTDSRTQPLRKGVTGLALAHYGFEPIRDRIGTTDLFGRKLQATAINDADPIAAVAVMLMGESDERSPMAIVEAPFLHYRDGGTPAEIQIPIENDLYGSQLLPR